MKRRRGLLFALGLVMAVSTVTPAIAAENTKDIIVQDSLADDTAVLYKSAKASSSWSEVSLSDGTTAWKLKIDGADAKDGIHKIDDSFYYTKDSFMVTGVQDVEFPSELQASYENGKYYFQEDKNDPSPTASGKLVSGDKWIETKAGKKIYVNEKGKIDETKTGLVDINGKTYLLGADGTVLKGVQEYSGKKYYFDEKTGVQRKSEGWFTLADKEILYLNDKYEITTPAQTDWLKVDGNQYYVKDGVSLKGFAVIEGKKYYFDANTGILSTGWIKDGSDTYYAGANGVIKTGWAWIDEEVEWFYFDADGKMHTGWLDLDGTRYYMDDNGIMARGWFQDGADRYCANASGILQTGWMWSDEDVEWFYLNADGKMHTGWLDLDGTRYYMDDKGVMARGWFQDGADRYCANASGILQTGWMWSDEDVEWFYLNADGKMHTGWLELDGNKYYMDDKGVMARGWFQAGTKRYYANASGILQAGGWIKDGSNWFYLQSDGNPAKGWFWDGSNWFYSNNEGIMQTGWFWDGSNWFYLQSNGVMARGWFWDGTAWFYSNGSGIMQKGWIWDGSNWFYLQSNGALAIGWFWDGTGWFYSNVSGVMQTGWIRDNGQRSYLTSSGRMVTQGWHYIDGYKFYFNGSGYLMQDLDGILPIQSRYEITINRANCQVTVYAKDGSNGYIIPVKTFACSVGLPQTPTDTGVFYTQDKHRWKELMGPSWGQYATRIYGGVLFHSVAGTTMSSYNIAADQYNLLGQPASHGCVRLNVRDAKWIYDNCVSGTKVTISDYAATPFDKPATIKIPAGQNWDPTDPAI